MHWATKNPSMSKKETVPRNLCNSNGYAKASKEIRKLLGRERRSTSRLGENNNDLRKEAKWAVMGGRVLYPATRALTTAGRPSRLFTDYTGSEPYWNERRQPDHFCSWLEKKASKGFDHFEGRNCCNLIAEISYSLTWKRSRPSVLKKKIQNIQPQISYVSQSNWRPRNKTLLSISALHARGFIFFLAFQDLRWSSPSFGGTI